VHTYKTQFFPKRTIAECVCVCAYVCVCVDMCGVCVCVCQYEPMPPQYVHALARVCLYACEVCVCMYVCWWCVCVRQPEPTPSQAACLSARESFCYMCICAPVYTHAYILFCFGGTCSVPEVCYSCMYRARIFCLCLHALEPIFDPMHTGVSDAFVHVFCSSNFS